jgi:hypothetical protein
MKRTEMILLRNLCLRPDFRRVGACETYSIMSIIKGPAQVTQKCGYKPLVALNLWGDFAAVSRITTLKTVERIVASSLEWVLPPVEAPRGPGGHSRRRSPAFTPKLFDSHSSMVGSLWLSCGNAPL